MAPSAKAPEELVAQAETLEENLRWMSEGTYGPPRGR